MVINENVPGRAANYHSSTDAVARVKCVHTLCKTINSSFVNVQLLFRVRLGPWKLPRDPLKAATGSPRF